MWSFIITGFYFYEHQDFISPINPDLTIADGLKYLLFVLVLFVIPIIAIRKFSKSDKGLSVMTIAVSSFILVVILAWSRFVWDDFQIYRGPAIIETNEILQTYQGESITYDQIELSDGMVVANPRELYAENWESLAPYFESINPINGLFNIILSLTKYLLLAGWSLTIFFIYGWLFLKTIFKEQKIPNPILLSLGAGTMISSLLLLTAAVAGKLNIFGLTLILGVIPTILIGIKHNETKKTIREIITYRTKPIKDIPYIQLIAILLIIFFSAWNFIQVISPWPSAFDDLVQYMNMPRLLAESGSLVRSDWGIYAFSLIQSIGTIITKNTALSQILTSLYGTMGALAIFSLVKKYSDEKIAWIISAITIALPIVFYHSHIDLKVEMPLFFFSILSIFAFDQWRENKNIKWLLLSGLLTGFALSIKLTAALLVITLILLASSQLLKRWGEVCAISGILFGLALLGYSSPINWIAGGIFLISIVIIILKNKRGLTRKLGSIAVMIFGIALPILPWFAINIAGHEDFSSLFNVLSSNPPEEKIEISYDEFDIDTSICSSPGNATGDYVKYELDTDNLFGIMRGPWDITMLTSTLAPATDPGFLFLAICPLILIIPFIKRREEIPIIFITGGIFYWIIWFYISNQVLWYGITGFVFLLMWLAIAIKYLLAKEKIIRTLTWTLIIIFLLMSFWNRSNWFLSRTKLTAPYLAGLINDSEFANNRFPEHEYLANILNSNPEDTIYITNNASLLFFIDQNNTRVYSDRYIDFFNCLYTAWDGDSEKIMAAFQESGFDYMVLSTPVNDPDLPTELFYASEEILEFANTNLVYIGGNAETHVFQIR